MNAKKCFHHSFTKYLFLGFFFTYPKIPPQAYFLCTISILRSFKVNANGPPVMPALDKTFYTEHAAEQKPQVNIPRELIHPESSHRPPPTQSLRLSIFFFLFLPLFPRVPQKYCFVLRGRGAAARGRRREGLMGCMLKLMGNTSQTHQEAFLTLMEKGRGWWVRGGVMQGSLVPKLLQSFSGLHCHPETSLTPPVSPLSSPSLPSSTAALSSFCLSFV